MLGNLTTFHIVCFLSYAQTFRLPLLAKYQMVRWYTSKYDIIYARNNGIFHTANVTKLTTAENKYVQAICTYGSQSKKIWKTHVSTCSHALVQHGWHCADFCETHKEQQMRVDIFCTQLYPNRMKSVKKTCKKI
jgi:hypothetical protein